MHQATIRDARAKRMARSRKEVARRVAEAKQFSPAEQPAEKTSPKRESPSGAAAAAALRARLGSRSPPSSKGPVPPGWQQHVDALAADQGALSPGRALKVRSAGGRRGSPKREAPTAAAAAAALRARLGNEGGVDALAADLESALLEIGGKWSPNHEPPTGAVAAAAQLGNEEELRQPERGVDILAAAFDDLESVLLRECSNEQLAERQRSPPKPLTRVVQATRPEWRSVLPVTDSGWPRPGSGHQSSPISAVRPVSPPAQETSLSCSQWAQDFVARVRERPTNPPALRLGEDRSPWAKDFVTRVRGLSAGQLSEATERDEGGRAAGSEAGGECQSRAMEPEVADSEAAVPQAIEAKAAAAAKAAEEEVEIKKKRVMAMVVAQAVKQLKKELEQTKQEASSAAAHAAAETSQLKGQITEAAEEEACTKKVAEEVAAMASVAEEKAAEEEAAAKKAAEEEAAAPKADEEETGWRDKMEVKKSELCQLQEQLLSSPKSDRAALKKQIAAADDEIAQLSGSRPSSPNRTRVAPDRRTAEGGEQLGASGDEPDSPPHTRGSDWRTRVTDQSCYKTHMKQAPSMWQLSGSRPVSPDGSRASSPSAVDGQTSGAVPTMAVVHWKGVTKKKFVVYRDAIFEKYGTQGIKSIERIPNRILISVPKSEVMLAILADTQLDPKPEPYKLPCAKAPPKVTSSLSGALKDDASLPLAARAPLPRKIAQAAIERHCNLKVWRGARYRIIWQNLVERYRIKCVDDV